MDAYLEIAERVLRSARRPMSARAILELAYKAQIVPSHLFGKTQHKTLQARISEDILERRDQSRFFRTAPGIFFLSDLVTDPAIPATFKTPFAARRRTRDLRQAPALAFDLDYLTAVPAPLLSNWELLAQDAKRNSALHYVDAKAVAARKRVLVWDFCVVRRGNHLLSYRIGRYRDDSDAFANKQTVGFPSLVTPDDANLFACSAFGVAESAWDAVLADLAISSRLFVDACDNLPRPDKVVLLGEGSQRAALLILEWQCPDWFEPTTRRLSLNNLCWIDTSVPPNNVADFDDWSIAAFHALS